MTLSYPDNVESTLLSITPRNFDETDWLDYKQCVVAHLQFGAVAVVEPIFYWIG